jgi:tetratricopeptide (TPR) repeat protein
MGASPEPQQMHDHIAKEVLDRFACGTADADERRRVAEHLLRGCRQCSEALIVYWPTAPLLAAGEGPDYEAALEQAVVRGLAAASAALPQATGRRLFAELQEHPPRRQETLVRNHPRYLSAELCRLLIERSHEERFSNTSQMRHFARLATWIGDRLFAADAGHEPLRLRAWASWGNALRVSGDLNAAEGAFAPLQIYLATAGAGSDEPLRAHLLSQLASLRFDQRLFAASLQLIEQVVEIWRRRREPLELARALVQQGIATGESGRPKAAVRLLVEAGRLLQGTGQPRLSLIALHSIIRFHADGGRADTALQLLVEARPLYEKADALIRVKARWLEGQVLSAMGHLETAVPLLAAARAALLEQGNHYEAAMVALDLAAGLAKLGRLPAVQTLAAETLREMKAQGVQREALAALILLMQAATGEVALRLIRRAAIALKRPLTPLPSPMAATEL